VAQAAAAARKAGVPVSTLLLGTAGGVVNQRLRVAGSSQTFVQTTQVPAEPAALKQLAAGSGGVAFDAATQAQGLAAVEAGLGQRLVHERRLREVTAGVTAAALVLILTGAALSSFWSCSCQVPGSTIMSIRAWVGMRKWCWQLVQTRRFESRSAS